MSRGDKMDDRQFRFAVLGIIGLVLAVGAALVLYDPAPVGKAVAVPQVQAPVQTQLATQAPATGKLCSKAAECRLPSFCSSVTDGLVSDGVDMGCVDSASNQHIPLCGHTTISRGNEACNFAGNPRCVCL